MLSKLTKYVLSAIFALVAIMIINSIEPSKNNGFSEYAGMTVGFLILGFVSYWLIGKFEKSDMGLQIQQRIKQSREINELKQKVNQDIAKYSESKHTFQYFSDEKLKSIYNTSSENRLNNYEQLALEEEMVKRGIIDYSPMHEKLYLMKKKFNL